VLSTNKGTFHSTAGANSQWNPMGNLEGVSSDMRSCHSNRELQGLLPRSFAKRPSFTTDKMFIFRIECACQCACLHLCMDTCASCRASKISKLEVRHPFSLVSYNTINTHPASSGSCTVFAIPDQAQHPFQTTLHPSNIIKLCDGVWWACFRCCRSHADIPITKPHSSTDAARMYKRARSHVCECACVSVCVCVCLRES
jgi:hypothetical protein